MNRVAGHPWRLRHRIRWLRRHLATGCALAAAAVALPVVIAGLIWREAAPELSAGPAASLLLLAVALATRRTHPTSSLALAALAGAAQVAMMAAPSAMLRDWAGAPNATAGCLLAAGALLVMGRRPFAAAFLGSMTLTVGGVATIAHAAGEPAAFSWGAAPPMKLPATLISTM
jgi:hypothetical protein